MWVYQEHADLWTVSSDHFGFDMAADWACRIPNDAKQTQTFNALS
jgi:hypothetical protein